jgi:vancomycin resistance protein YoaR
MNENTILPGVSVAGVDLAGLDERAAERKLRETLPDLSAGELALSIGAVNVTIPYDDFERDWDMDYMLGQAVALGRQGSFVDQLREQIGLLRADVDIAPVMSWDAEELTSRVAAAARSAEVEVVDATVTRHDGHYAFTEARQGTDIDVDAAVAQAMAVVNSLSPDDTSITVPGTTIEPQVSTEAASAAVSEVESVSVAPLTLAGEDLSADIDEATIRGWVHLNQTGVASWEPVVDQAPIEQWVATYALETDVPARNATFSVGGGGAINVVASAPGRAADVTPTAENIKNALMSRTTGTPQNMASFSFLPVEPTLTTDQARAIAPRVKKLGEWTTYYVPSPELNGNGVNIQIPTNVLDGMVVEPDAQFDFLTAIGPITSPPYEAGGALVHGQIIEDSIIGGGMCSVSTTLFNAALRYGLPIWARDNHSLYISRYPVGLDATVWMTDKKNRQTMGFVNDTGYPLVIRGINSPGAVTFQIFGVDDGRTVTLSEPVVENTVKPDYQLWEYTNDLAPGRRSKYNDAYSAFDSSVVRTVYNKAGEVILEENYKSHYKQLPAYIRVGRSDGDPRDGRVVRVRNDTT